MNEDTPYLVNDFATPDNKSSVDVDQPNKSVLVEVLENIRKDIEQQSTFDALDLPKNATPEQKMAAFDEIAIHKGLVLHLKKYETMISNKVKELK